MTHLDMTHNYVNAPSVMRASQHTPENSFSTAFVNYFLLDIF